MLIQTVKSVKIYNTCTCIHFESKPRYRSNSFIVYWLSFNLLTLPSVK